MIEICSKLPRKDHQKSSSALQHTIVESNIINFNYSQNTAHQIYQQNVSLLREKFHLLELTTNIFRLKFIPCPL